MTRDQIITKIEEVIPANAEITFANITFIDGDTVKYFDTDTNKVSE